MLKLCHPARHPLEVAPYLEEAGVPHQLVAVDTPQGELFPQNARLAAR